MNKKYEFTGETLSHDGVILHRIKRLSDGEVGGWIESEGNLSHDGGCWVAEEAKIFWGAQVYGNAQVYGHAHISSGALVHGNAKVYDHAIVSSWSEIYGNAQVYGNAIIYDYADVYGNAQVSGDATVWNNAYVCGEAEVHGDAIVSGGIKIHGFVHYLPRKRKIRPKGFKTLQVPQP